MQPGSNTVDLEAPTTRQSAGDFARWRAPLLALLLALGSLAYYGLVYAPSVAAFNQENNYSGGNGSDLYSRWYGARELLLHGRDPYSAELTAEMQRGFVGRDPLPGEDLPEWSVFAQPLYTVFLIAPLVLLSFNVVQPLTTVLFPLFIALGTVLWLPALGTRPTWPRAAIAFLLAISAPATLYAANFQQLAALVFLCLSAALLLIHQQRYIPAGILLALSTIKPQESWLLLGLLFVWALFGWRERRNLLFSFAATMLILFLAAELLLPGWLFKFIASLSRYSEQTSGLSMFSSILPGPVLLLLAAAWLLLLAWIAWQVRHEQPTSTRLAIAAASALAITVTMIPAYLQYERLFLLPALLTLLWNRDLWSSPRSRMAYNLTLPAMLSPWLLAAILGTLAAIGIAVLDFPSALIALPWLPYLLLPYLAALILLHTLAPRSPIPLSQEGSGPD